MKKVLAFVVIVFAAFWASDAFSQNIPLPSGYVNDFANIIPNNVKQEIEQALRDYEVKTTNEIAVVTVSSLGGLSIEDYTMKLAEKWKVGKKEKDNGLILLVAPTERKVRIEVGYRLEGVMPDAQAKLIIERVIIPKFKSGDMAGGIKAGVDSIISKIESVNSPSLPKEEAATGKEEPNYSLVVGVVLSLIGVSIVSFLLAGYIRRKYRKWRNEAKRRNRAREEAKTGIERAKNSLSDIRADFDELKKVITPDSYPRRIIDEMLSLETKILEERVDALSMEVEYNLKKNPDFALSFAKEAKSRIVSFYDRLDEFRKKKKLFDEARIGYKDVLLRAENAAKDFESYLLDLKQKGYRTSSVSDEILKKCSGYIKSAQKRLNDDSGAPDYEAIVRDAQLAEGLVINDKNCWEKFLIRQKENERKIREQNEWLEELPQLREQSGNYFRELQAHTPTEIWDPAEKELKQEEKWVSVFEGHINQAINLNSMTEQFFDGAEEALAKAGMTRKIVEGIFSKPEAIHQEYIQAKNQTKNLRNQVEAAISEAKNAMNDSDAGGAGRTNLQESLKRLSRAGMLQKSSLPNWIVIASLLAGVLTLAQAAKRDAELNINIEQMRRRKKRQEEEEEEQRRSSYSSSSVGSSDDSSGSSSSFGGFGGGSFGGGGASGGW